MHVCPSCRIVVRQPWHEEVNLWTAAAVLGVTVHEAETLCREGILPARRSARGRWRVKGETLRAFLSQGGA